MSSGDRLRAAVPLLVLALVAMHQIRLARTAPLTPWKGGGFGMFSTTDSLSTRRLRIVVSAPGRGEEIEPPAGLHKLAARALALPDAARLERLARAIAREERAAGRPVDAVELEVLGRSYSEKTLFASELRLGHHEYQDDRFAAHER